MPLLGCGSCCNALQAAIGTPPADIEVIVRALEDNSCSTPSTSPCKNRTYILTYFSGALTCLPSALNVITWKKRNIGTCSADAANLTFSLVCNDTNLLIQPNSNPCSSNLTNFPAVLSLDFQQGLISGHQYAAGPQHNGKSQQELYAAFAAGDPLYFAGACVNADFPLCGKVTGGFTGAWELGNVTAEARLLI